MARRLVKQPLRTMGVGAALAVLGATAAFGGLEPADDRKDFPGVEVGRTVHVAPFDITVKRVVWVDRLPNVYPTEAGNRWLAITATVRNTHHESLYGAAELAQAVRLTGVAGLVQKPKPGADGVTSTYRKVLADTTDLTPVQPDMTYEMAFLFEQRASATPPSEVTVQLFEHTWRQDSIDKTMKWLDPAVVAESTLPMRPSVQPSATPSDTASGEPSGETSQEPSDEASEGGSP